MIVAIMLAAAAVSLVAALLTGALIRKRPAPAAWPSWQPVVSGALGSVTLDDGFHTPTTLPIQEIFLRNGMTHFRVLLKGANLDLVRGTVWRIFGPDGQHVVTGAYGEGDVYCRADNPTLIYDITLSLMVDGHRGQRAKRLGLN